MKYVYHYHATSQTVVGEITHLDGILYIDEPIKSYERYLEVKESVANWQSPHLDPSKLIICNLALLHTIEDEVQPIFK